MDSKSARTLAAQASYQSIAPFVDGEMSESQGKETFEVVNPSNGRLCLRIPSGSDEDVNRAVSSARRAFADGRWSDAPPSAIKRALHRLADLIDQNTGLLDALDAGEMGKPVGEKFGNAASASQLMRFYAEAVDKRSGDVYVSEKHSFVAQLWVPRGVIAAVVPWNFPTYIAIVKIAPALAAGNCVVLKPSELSSRSAMVLARLAMDAGIPPGVFNVVPGVGERVGRSLGLSRDIDMLTFTGSTDVGRRMLQYAAQSNMKVVLAECGGKSPQIVFGDGVDLEAAARTIARMIVTNQGQICSVGSRVLVQRKVEPLLLEKIVGHLKEIVIGDALDPRTTYGPLVSSKQLTRVMQFIEAAESEGAELVSGGRRVSQSTGGFFVEPTVFRGVRPYSRIAQEEIFGPVLSVIPFEDESEAIEIANATRYGLSAYVWTASLSTGMRMAKGIRSAVRINAAAPIGEGPGYAASHEPAGESGFGTEGGIAGMESYMRRQRVWFTHA